MEERKRLQLLRHHGRELRPGIQVTFYLTDAHEMNWVTEFLDSSFLIVTKPKNSFS